jgi:hypothetical protein
MKITVTMTLPDEDLENGWNGKPHELALSVRARLNEIYGDDSMDYCPDVKCVDVQLEGAS